MNTCPLGEIVKWASIFIGKVNVNVSWPILGRCARLAFSQRCCKSLVPKNRLYSRLEPKLSPSWKSMVLPEHTRFCYCFELFTFLLEMQRCVYSILVDEYFLWGGGRKGRVGKSSDQRPLLKGRIPLPTETNSRTLLVSVGLKMIMKLCSLIQCKYKCVFTWLSFYCVHMQLCAWGMRLLKIRSREIIFG